MSARKPSSRASLTGVLASASLAGVLVATGACYGPTEVTLYITTEHACASDRRAGDVAASATVVTAIKVGAVTAADAPVAELNECTDRPGLASFIGTLVVVPSRERDARVTVQVTMTTNGASAQECASPTLPDYCIVARRSFAFIEHASLTLPIRLYEACRGVRCADEATTCGSNGKCESATVQPDGCPASQPDCQSSVDTPPDAAADAPQGDAVAEAGIDVDAVAPGACSGPAKDHVLAPVPALLTGNAGTPPNGLASSTTHLFWTAPFGGPSALTRLMRIRKDGAGGPEVVGQPVTGTAIAIAANDTYAWVVTSGGATRFTLANASSTPLASGATVAVEAVALRPSSPAYFVVDSSASGRTVGTENDAVLSVYDASSAGDLLAVSATHLFTAMTGKARRHLLLGMTMTPVPVDIGISAPNAIAADGSTLFVSHREEAPTDGRLSRYTEDGAVTVLGLAETPGAIAIDGAGIFLLDHGKAGGKTATVRRQSNPASVSLMRIPAITPPMGAVGGLAVDAGNGPCFYFMGSDDTGSRLFVYPKAAPAR